VPDRALARRGLAQKEGALLPVCARWVSGRSGNSQLPVGALSSFFFGHAKKKENVLQNVILFAKPQQSEGPTYLHRHVWPVASDAQTMSAAAWRSAGSP